MRLRVRSIAILFFAAEIFTVNLDAQEIGFIEKFALATDREAVLQELIPGSEDYYYYYCLHYQNTKQLAKAQTLLNDWRTKIGDSPRAKKIETRQQLLSYPSNHAATLDYLRRELGLNLDHAPPQADRAKDLPTRLDPALIARDRLIAQAIAMDPNYSRLTEPALATLLSRTDLNKDQQRAVLARITRVDWDQLVPAIERELRLIDSRGFGAIPIHAQLTLAQRQDLARRMPQLLEQDVFVRQYLVRLSPSDDADLTDINVQRNHLQRLETFTDSLPASQINLKANVLFHRLQFDATQGVFDRPRFMKYLGYPRQQSYYNQDLLRNQPNLRTLEFSTNYATEIRRPPIQNDAVLIRQYLEHFFQTEDNISPFAAWLDRAYLQNVLAETRILYGLGPSQTWYDQLSPSAQREIRERVELRFATTSREFYQPQDSVSFLADVKNVPQLIVRIYKINARNAFRKNGRPINTDLDLDGLVANAEQTLTYATPTDRRHRETIPLPQLEGRGVWVVDLLGGGLRSRALIQKGQLRSVQRLTDAGHEFFVLDENGKKIPAAHIEVGNRKFTADKNGAIIIPYAEETRNEQALLVDGPFSTLEPFQHLSESYSLECGFLLDTQNLISGQRGSIILRPQLLCNGQPSSLELLKNAQLQITTVDQDGVEATQNVPNLVFKNDREFTHQFLVPQRLATIRMSLVADIHSLSRNVTSKIATSQSFNVNEASKTAIVSDFFLVQDSQGYRLQVRGRNGEPIARLPVTINLQAEYLTSPDSYTLATDPTGQISLGNLAEFVTMQTSAESLTSRSFTLQRRSLDWPADYFATLGQTIRLPWYSMAESGGRPNLTLVQIRSGALFADHKATCLISAGQLTITGLEAGTYRLQDYTTNTVMQIKVAEGNQQDGFMLGASQSFEATERTAATLSKANVVDGKLQIQVANGDAETRVHLIASPFLPDRDLGRLMHLSAGKTYWQSRQPTHSYYVNSLRLDEEYQYILQRQYAKKYPGNLLTQPSLLLNPWDTASTASDRRDATAGDALMAAAPPQNAASLARKADGEQRKQAGSGLSTSYDFLAKGSVLIANLVPNDAGLIEIPLAQLSGYQTVTAILVHPTGTSSQVLPIPATEIPTRDLRLAKAFDASKHLTQRQTARVLNAGEKINLGDARSTRVQIYSNIADVYRLYSTLVPSPDWERFRVLTRWQTLTEEQKQSQYNDLACHELHLFLYFKDRPFFDKVVKPYLKDKFERQLIDRWLLEEDLTEYVDLWQMGRLNTVERILLSIRLRDKQAGTRKWLTDWVSAHPVAPQNRSQRFNTALAGTALDFGSDKNVDFDFRFNQSNFGAMVPLFSTFDDNGIQDQTLRSRSLALGSVEDKSRESLEKLAESKTELERAELAGIAAGGMAGRGGRGGGGGGGRGAAPRRAAGQLEAERQLFRSLETTRQWAENQYYHVGLSNQTLALAPPNAFWKELSERDSISGFLPKNLDLPCSTLSEALLALSILDLPLESGTVEMAVDDGRLTVTSQHRAVAFVESIEPVVAAPKDASLLVGQDIYLATPSSDPTTQKPLTGQSLVRGVGYRASIVVTNPTSLPQTISVLTQLPAGSIPLEAGKITRSHDISLNPYSTQQVQATFYFPASGEFDHYGTQVSVNDAHVAAAESKKLKILDQPEQLDKETWGYIADWGTNDQVIEFLSSKNAQQVDLSRIAFRLKDKEFFGNCLRELTRQHLFEPNLWAYSILHDDRLHLAEFLAYRNDIVERCGPIFVSEVFSTDTAERYEYQHLDYRPLVVARAHQLGPKRVILNDRLLVQYQRLLNRVAHQPKIDSADSMVLTYYMLLQNRIEESIKYFEAVKSTELITQLQYDYFSAYLNFFRGEFPKAAETAAGYANYGVPRWRELFAQVASQVRQRRALVDHVELASSSIEANTDANGRLLSGSREIEQSAAAASIAALDLQQKDGQLFLTHQNLDSVDINYYLMDIELLFSRNPFVQQDSDRLITILPNETRRLAITGKSGQQQLTLPEAMRNRNVLVEVAAGPIIRSQVVYANTLNVTVVDAFGRLQVLAQEGGAPVEQSYVKVYARNAQGVIRFYKDGYTDLRGQFDYASLSTNDLDTVSKFAILILHPQRGALIREAQPPKR